MDGVAHTTMREARAALIEDIDRPWDLCCAFCRHWHSAGVVIDGSTIGHCDLWGSAVPSAWGCKLLEKQSIRVLCVGEKA